MRILVGIVLLNILVNLWYWNGPYQESKAHNDCVDARKIELIVGKPARKCPAASAMNETWGHSFKDHGV